MIVCTMQHSDIYGSCVMYCIYTMFVCERERREREREREGGRKRKRERGGEEAEL